MAFAKDIEKKLRKKRRSKTADFSQLMTKNHHGDFELNKTEELPPNQIEEELLGTNMNREKTSNKIEGEHFRAREIKSLKTGCKTTQSVTQKYQRNSLPMFDLNDDAANESF